GPARLGKLPYSPLQKASSTARCSPSSRPRRARCRCSSNEDPTKSQSTALYTTKGVPYAGQPGGLASFSGGSSQSISNSFAGGHASGWYATPHSSHRLSAGKSANVTTLKRP